MSSSSPITLNYLVFDDENDEANQNALNVKIPGFTCNYIFINPIDFYIVGNDTFDIEAFKNKIIEETKGYQISLVATDWNMLHQTTNHNEINGLEVIEILLAINEKYRKCQFLIYSGKATEASQVLIEKIKNEIAQNDSNQTISSLELLSLLLEIRIKFCPRNSRFGEISTLIKNEKTISLMVLNALVNFDDNLIINTGNPDYDGRTIKSLIELITQNNDLGLKFIREFIELSISNYTELNIK